MMNAFFRRAHNEYKRQVDLKKSFERQTERIKSIIAPAVETNGNGAASKRENHEKSLLLLFPLLEIAWADGRVAQREMDAIVEAAESYGLVNDAQGYRGLIERFLLRPSPPAVDRLWQDFQYFLENLPEQKRRTVIFALLTQTHFVAEKSSDNIVGFLRGERLRQAEREVLKIVSARLETAKKAADEAERQKMVETAQPETKEFYIARSTEHFGDVKNDNGKTEKVSMPAGDFAKLIPLVPLVKVAWAEGRITRRERALIFIAAERMGVEPGSSAYQRLCDWFELHPTDEFYTESLERLRELLEKLPEEERILRRLDLLSDCVNVAEASGGSSRFPAGGTRICDEETAAVKRIASKLNGKGGAALAA